MRQAFNDVAKETRQHSLSVASTYRGGWCVRVCVCVWCVCVCVRACVCVCVCACAS